MSKVMVIRGICVSCKYGPQCLNHHGAVVMQCAQFEGYDFAPAHASRARPLRHEVTDTGLCTRCAVETACTLPRAESGVWCCADFR